MQATKEFREEEKERGKEWQAKEALVGGDT